MTRRLPLQHLPLRHLGVPAAAVLLGALPLLVTRPAPLQDWSNHIARIHILDALLHGEPFWSKYYRVSGFLVPDAAMDLCIEALSRLGLPLGIAAQCFLLVTYGVFVAGFCALAGSLASWSAIKPVFAVLLFYGNALFWGLVSYVLGLGLLMALLALWLRAAPTRWRRPCLAAAGAAALLFTHLVAAALWVVLLAGFDLHRLLYSGRPWPRRALSSASWLAALVACAVLLHGLPGAGGPDFSLGYAGSGIGIVTRKLWLFAKLLLGGGLAQDAASLAALLACVASVAVSRPALPPAAALAAAVLLATALLAPERIGTGSQLDARLALAPLLLLAAAVRIRPPMAASGLASLAVCARTLVLAGSWHGYGQVFAQYRRAAAGLPSGSLMMMAYGTPLASLSWQQIWSPPITSIATQAVLHGMFMPAIFANPAQQPIALLPRYLQLKQPWNLSDPAHRRASALALGHLCAQHAFPEILLTVLYPGPWERRQGPAVLRRQRDFVILDACALR